MPSVIPWGLSALIHSFLFSNWRRTVSSNFFDTPVSKISTVELVLSRHACCVLSGLRCNGHSLLLSFLSLSLGLEESRIPCAAPADTLHLILHCPATGSASFALWSRPWRVARLLGLHGLPSLERGRVATTHSHSLSACFT